MMKTRELLLETLRRLRRAADRNETSYAGTIAACDPLHVPGARNLVRTAAVVALESPGDRAAFHAAGLLAPSEGPDDLETHFQALGRALGKGSEVTSAAGISGTDGAPGKRASEEGAPGAEAPGEGSMQERVTALLGPGSRGRSTRIMVTLGAEALEPATLVPQLLAGGMNVVRINCGRDGEETWESLASLVRKLAPEGSCRVLMDLPGPKLRVAWLGGEERLRLHAGDSLGLLRKPAGNPGNETPGDPPVVGISTPEALHALAPGHPVWFDDGKLGGIVESVEGHLARVRITFPAGRRQSLRLQRSLNLPGTPVDLPVLTGETRKALSFAARHADMIALSFVRSAEDVAELLGALHAETVRRPGVVVKIENAAAVSRLLEILLAAMRVPQTGILLARGDLAVECGFEALPFIQEKLLLFCRAARLPLFIATDILERMSRKGRPSRSGIVDAFHAGRAQCVMLNRGPGTPAALTALDALLRRREEAARAFPPAGGL